LGVPQYRLSRYGESTSKRKAGKQNKTSEAKFPRNLATAFTRYLSERPGVKRRSKWVWKPVLRRPGCAMLF